MSFETLLIIIKFLRPQIRKRKNAKDFASSNPDGTDASVTL